MLFVSSHIECAILSTWVRRFLLRGLEKVKGEIKRK